MSLSGDPGAQRAATVGEEPAVFRLRNVTKHFGGVTAVEEVGFDLRPGEVHALVGENGAGKSTLMKMVHGLYRPDEGMLEVGGEVVEFSSPRDAETAGIAMIPQELDLFPELSVTENLFVGRPRPRTGWGGLDRNAMRAEARRRLSSLGVDLDVTTTVKRLSAANQQIVAIARALVGEAQAVVMDEPTASLTERETQQLFGIISDLTSGGVGVVYISHRLEEVFAISDRITVLRDGHHITTAPTSELDAEELVRLMVGRPLHELFTRSASSPGEVTLEVRGLSRAGEFEDVDLVVRRGEIVGLSGLVGAGRRELSIRGAKVSDPVNRLSGGNQQKVVLAKSLAREPQILLLDEPTRGIDVGAKSEIYRLIDDLAKEGKAILLISSELEEVLSMSDRIVVMREGRVTGEFARGEASQEQVMTAATGGRDRQASNGSREEASRDE